MVWKSIQPDLKRLSHSLLKGEIEFSCFRGAVAGAVDQTHTSTSTSASAVYYGNQPNISVRTTTRTRTDREIYINDGIDERCYVASGDFAVRPGHDVSICLAKYVGESTGFWVGAYNHTMDRFDIAGNPLSRFSTTYWKWFPQLLLWPGLVLQLAWLVPKDDPDIAGVRNAGAVGAALLAMMILYIFRHGSADTGLRNTSDARIRQFLVAP